MSKNAVISARIEDKLKRNAELILSKLGITPSEAITIFYKQVELRKGLPFEVKIPNKITMKAFQDSENGKNIKSHKNLNDLYEDLGI
ncbi:MAG: type II toxin-antitoxin system RelB/DinJ family antitoxin [Spirochaetia bacterium]|nr:type II toxin-antitoxin system RelB/DinJ family antitoxin [Spirochaetia bacterium]